MNKFKKLRHKWELPLIWLNGLITIGFIIGAIAYLSYKFNTNPEIIIGDAEIPEDVTNALLIIMGAFFGPILIYFIRLFSSAGVEAGAVRVTEKQYPELYLLYKNIADKMDLKVVPKFYVTNGNGVLNAFALSCNRRNKIVVIHSELAKIYKNSPRSIEFVLAHELAHHKLGHTTLFRNIISVIPNFVKFLGASASRAQEYSADRVAMNLIGDTSALTSLGAGIDFYADTDMEEYHKQCLEQQKSFMMRIVNWFSGHAILTKRYLALKAYEKNGPSSHGEMF